MATASAFGVSLDFLVYLFIATVIYYFVLFETQATGARVGLAITQSLSLSGLLQWGVRQTAEVANQLMSVERIFEYSQLESEKQPDSPRSVIQGWPAKGQIEFKNVCYRYYAEAEPVIRNLSFCIRSNEKIGIVGRTGAGKLLNDYFTSDEFAK